MERLVRWKVEPEKLPEVKAFKIAVVGEQGCGKTTICKWMVGEEPLDAERTIGSDFYATFIPGSSGTKIQVNLWDLSGDKYF